RRSRRSSTRPKYPRRDSLHPAGAVAWRGARAVRSRGPVAAVGTRGDAPRGPGPGGGRVARRPARAPGGAESTPSGRPSGGAAGDQMARSEEHTSELQSRGHLVCRLLLEKKKIKRTTSVTHLRCVKWWSGRRRE